MNKIEFRVYGIPKPGGSKKGFVIPRKGAPKTGGSDNFRSIITDDSKRVKYWKADVKDAALRVAPDTPLDCPLRVSVTFYLARPKAHYRTGKYAGQLKSTAPMHHTNMPDALTLMRGTEAALTGIIWKDDSRIYHETIIKTYGDRPGALITIEWDGGVIDA